MHLWHESMVMSEPVHFGGCVEAADGCTVHVPAHKADAYAFGLCQVLEASYEVMPLSVVLPCTHHSSSIGAAPPRQVPGAAIQQSWCVHSECCKLACASDSSS